ncbi:hypothetical protein CI688_05500 [Shigella sonnei]|nr:hypothetical protein CI688_05500 [Shigella sonnei]
MMSLWDALRMNMMISYQELIRTFPSKSDLSRNLLRFIGFAFPLASIVFRNYFPIHHAHEDHLCRRYF